jgi:hypothetical protein
MIAAEFSGIGILRDKHYARRFAKVKGTERPSDQSLIGRALVLGRVSLRRRIGIDNLE